MANYFSSAGSGFNFTLIYVGVNVFILFIILILATIDTRKGLLLRHIKADAQRAKHMEDHIELQVTTQSQSGGGTISVGGSAPPPDPDAPSAPSAPSAPPDPNVSAMSLGARSQSGTPGVGPMLSSSSASMPSIGKGMTASVAASQAEFLTTDDPRLEQKMNDGNNNLNDWNMENEIEILYPVGPGYDEPTHERVSSMLNSDGTVDESCIGTTKFCCKTFWIDILTKTFLYSAMLVHIWDSGSDFGVIYTYYYSDEWKHLAYISGFVMIAYRIFSSFSLWRAQRGWRDVILQFCDCHIFLEVYRSSVVQHATDTLYWIRTMEAVLESFPQMVLSLVFLFDSLDIFVFVSLLGSLVSIVFSLLHYTNVVFAFTGVKGFITFWIRFAFRLCEVLGRAMILALLWRTFDQWGGWIVGTILVTEFIFYGLLTQFLIPPWELAAFLIANVDLTLTFEGREGALTKPLRKNIFYRLLYKPVSEMFTSIQSDDLVEKAVIYHPSSIQEERLDYHTATEHTFDEERQKLLIAPAHYVFRFLESCFQVFCILTYCVLDTDIRNKVFNQQIVLITAISCNILTPVLYCIVRSFANEHKTLERNLIALVLDAGANQLTKLTSEIHRLIGAGAKLSQRDYLGNTIVHACVRTNNHELLKRLIRSRKAPLTKPNYAGFTPIMEACKYGSLECLKLLSSLPDIDLNVKHYLDDHHRRRKHHHGGRGEGLLHMAAMYDHINIINWLCNKEINPNFDKYQVYTGNVNACHAACVHGCLDALNTLIANGISCKTKVQDGDGCQHIAAERGYVAILRVLYSQGVNMNERGRQGHTPLFRAAIHNHSTTMKLCAIEFGCDLYIGDKNNITIAQALFELTQFKGLSVLALCEYDFRQMLHGPNKKELKKLLDKEDDDKITAAMWACKKNDVQLLGRLILAGCDVNHVNTLDETAAHFAAGFGSLDCLKLLYTAEAILTHSNALLKTPLDKCKEHGHNECVEFLESVTADDNRTIVDNKEVEELAKLK